MNEKKTFLLLSVAVEQGQLRYHAETSSPLTSKVKEK